MHDAPDNTPHERGDPRPRGPRDDRTLAVPAGTDADAPRRAIGAATGLDPADVRLAPAGDVVPTVVLTVQDGRAEIAAVSGTVRVIHADLDRDPGSLSPHDLDAILRPGLHDGTPGEVAEAVENAREALGKFVPTTPAPAPDSPDAADRFAGLATALGAIRRAMPPDSTLAWEVSPDRLYLACMHIPAWRRRTRTGQGTEALARVLAAADEAGLPIGLVADPTDEPGDPDTNTLVHHYRRFGFEVVGEDRDTESPRMVRLPRPPRDGHEAVLRDHAEAKGRDGAHACAMPHDWLDDGRVLPDAAR